MKCISLASTSNSGNKFSTDVIQYTYLIIYSY